LIIDVDESGAETYGLYMVYFDDEGRLVTISEHPASINDAADCGDIWDDLLAMEFDSYRYRPCERENLVLGKRYLKPPVKKTWRERRIVKRGFSRDSRVLAYPSGQGTQ
jgi:hypothetical protein